MMKAGNSSEAMSVSYSVRDRTGRKIARDRCDDGACELRAECVIGMASEIGAEIFVCVARGEIGFEQTFDGLRDIFRGAAIADLPRNAGVLANGAAYAEVVGIDEIRALLDFFAFEADVGDPVLAASVGAAGDVQFERLIEFRDALFEFFDEPAREGFGLSDGEFAEFGAGASDGAAPER